MDQETTSDCSAWWIWLCKICAWLTDEDNQPYVQLAVFFASVFVLYLTMFSCQLCVVAILVFSLFFCCLYRLMFIVTCASIGVLWYHGWRFSVGRDVAITWS